MKVLDSCVASVGTSKLDGVTTDISGRGSRRSWSRRCQRINKYLFEMGAYQLSRDISARARHCGYLLGIKRIVPQTTDVLSSLKCCDIVAFFDEALNGGQAGGTRPHNAYTLAQVC